MRDIAQTRLQILKEKIEADKAARDRALTILERIASTFERGTGIHSPDNPV
jgi:hypothetical protein